MKSLVDTVLSAAEAEQQRKAAETFKSLNADDEGATQDTPRAEDDKGPRGWSSSTGGRGGGQRGRGRAEEGARGRRHSVHHMRPGRRHWNWLCSVRREPRQGDGGAHRCDLHLPV